MKHLWIMILLALTACTSAEDGAAECVRSPGGESCICGPFESAREPVDVCEPAAVGAAAYCCTFPATDECACARPTCLQATNVNVCSCDFGLYSFDIEAQERDVCLPQGGGTCCLFEGANGSTCTCTGGSRCLPGETEVAACRPSDVRGCGDDALPAATCAAP
jgi:hypothetical protein